MGHAEAISLVDADGSGQRRLTPRLGDERAPAWSPDGRLIAFVHDRGIYVVNANGTDRHRVTSDADDDDEPAWEPDGAWIAFVRHPKPLRPSLRLSGSIDLVHPDGSNEHRLTRPTEDPVQGRLHWTPDGTKLSFVSTPAELEDLTPCQCGELNVINADGTGQRRLTTSDDTLVSAWSPDGATIAFIFSDATGLHVDTMDADGRSRRALTTGPRWISSRSGRPTAARSRSSANSTMTTAATSS